MAVRRRTLPAGWYPDDRAGVEEELRSWGQDDAAAAADAFSAIAPHAGWYFSGRIAWSAWLSARPPDAVVIVGGHLPASYPFLYYAEDGFDTPLGVVAADRAVVERVGAALGMRADTEPDNTVEVHLPMAASRFPGVPVACFRAPNDARAAGLGLALADCARETGKRLFVLGSTDLTHYGRAYGFEPAGRGARGFSWARSADDAIVSAFVDMDGDAALREAEDKRSACSVGAALAAMAYARALGVAKGELVARGSSDEKARGDSRVGYAAVAFAP